MTQKEQEYIIEQCIKGSNKAREKVYKAFADRLYATCIYYTHNTEDANDLLQEGFIKIFSNISKFKNRGSFEGWMRRIIINLALEKHRKHHYLYPVDDITAYDDIDQNDIESNLSAAEIISLVRELTPQYQMVFNLYAIEGYSHKEIGAMLNISEGTSKSNLSRARTILQRKITEQNEPVITSVGH